MHGVAFVSRCRFYLWDKTLSTGLPVPRNLLVNELQLVANLSRLLILKGGC